MAKEPSYISPRTQRILEQGGEETKGMLDIGAKEALKKEEEKKKKKPDKSILQALAKLTRRKMSPRGRAIFELAKERYEETGKW